MSQRSTWPWRPPQYQCRTSESRVSFAKEAFTEYLDRTGELRVYLAREALTVLVQNKRVKCILG